MTNLVSILRQIGCTKAKTDGLCQISDLRDERWVKMFAEKGYKQGELIFPDGGHSSFFLVLPDGNIASADNVMCANGFYAVANELEFDADSLLSEEPYGDFTMYVDEDGMEQEDCAISIWTPQEFTEKLKQCKRLMSGMNESKKSTNKIMEKKTITLTETDIKNMIMESVHKILDEGQNYGSDPVSIAMNKIFEITPYVVQAYQHMRNMPNANQDVMECFTNVWSASTGLKAYMQKRNQQNKNTNL